MGSAFSSASCGLAASRAGGASRLAAAEASKSCVVPHRRISSSSRGPLDDALCLQCVYSTSAVEINVMDSLAGPCLVRQKSRDEHDHCCDDQRPLSPASRAWSECCPNASSALGQHEDTLLHAVAHEQAQQAQRGVWAAQAAQGVGASQGLHVSARVPIRIQHDD